MKAQPVPVLPRITLPPAAIVTSVAAFFGLPARELLQPSRQKSRGTSEARHIAGYLLVHCYGLRVGTAARLMGYGRFRAFIKSMQQVEDLASVDADYRARLMAIAATMAQKKLPL